MPLNTDRVWAELYANIRAFVGRRVRQPADADDIVQEVFLRVHRALPTLRDADKLHPWVYQTTRRAIADHYRAPAQRREVSAGAAVDLMSVEQLPVATPDEHEKSALLELTACLKPLIDHLAVADQQALQLVEFDGLTQVEAAGRLGLSVSGMKSRVQRARLRLRSALDECCRVVLDRRGAVIEHDACVDQNASCGNGVPGRAKRPTDPV